jgi:two-component system vancomycin resistance associated response regulator VraR
MFGKEYTSMPKRILIADDDEDLRTMIRWFIESRTECEVCGEAVNGLDAIEKARTLNPDLILLDYSMTAMNGVETGAVLKAMLPDVPVVLFTGQDTGAIESAAMSVGIRAVVPKTDIDRLVVHLETLLD